MIAKKSTARIDITTTPQCPVPNISIRVSEFIIQSAGTDFNRVRTIRQSVLRL